MNNNAKRAIMLAQVNTVINNVHKYALVARASLLAADNSTPLIRCDVLMT